ncbi:hypothetical protein Pmani_027746 [Petrolisthes manimaculis]|uniref:Uncharacterized protein n=1 Tax=Petrolisthes manimaculis TaxID=1843537 RepID=A0AAE1P1H0_9EUCA|nr:hypothetical protein Pmani_027746 [Petrolisthes manimaculis]
MPAWCPIPGGYTRGGYKSIHPGRQLIVPLVGSTRVGLEVSEHKPPLTHCIHCYTVDGMNLNGGRWREAANRNNGFGEACYRNSETIWMQWDHSASSTPGDFPEQLYPVVKTTTSTSGFSDSLSTVVRIPADKSSTPVHPVLHQRRPTKRPETASLCYLTNQAGNMKREA